MSDNKQSSSNTNTPLKGGAALAAQRDTARAERDAAIRERDLALTAVANITEALRQAQERITALEAAAAAAPKTKAAKKEKPKNARGRTINQVLAHNIRDGETIHRSVGKVGQGKIYTATYHLINVAKDGSGHIMLEVDKTAQPTAWGAKTIFSSPSNFASACAAVHDGDNKPHHINGWNVCYVVRDGKKIYLRDLRVAGAATPAKEHNLHSEPKTSRTSVVSDSDSESDSESEAEDDEDDEDESDADVDAI